MHACRSTLEDPTNLTHGQGAVYHLEDLLHQGGHVAFQAMTMDPSSVLAVAPDTVLEGDAGPEERTAYVVLHAVVTERWMARGLLALLERRLVAGLEEVEARGRLAYVLQRYVLDLLDLVGAGVTTPRGTGLLRRLLADLRALSASAEAWTRGLSLAGQPYNFDLATLLDRNPDLARVAS